MEKKRVSTLTLTLTSSLLISLAISQPAQAETLSEYEAEKSKLEEKAGNLNSSYQLQEEKLAGLEADRKEFEAAARNLQTELDSLTVQAMEQEEQLEEVTLQSEKLKKEIEDLETAISQRTKKLESQARFLQTNGNMSNLLEILFHSESLAELIGSSEAVYRIVSTNRETLAAQEEDQRALVEKEGEVERKIVELEELGNRIAVTRSNLATQKGELDSKLQKLAEEYQLNEKELQNILNTQQSVAAETGKLTERIKEEQARLIAEEEQRQAKAQEEAVAMAGEIMPDLFEEESVAVVASAKTGSSSGTGAREKSAAGFIRPSNGVVTSPFGYRIHPITGAWKLHGGIDFGGYGPIVAAQGGTVLVAGYHNSWGYYVKIDHGNGLQTLYAHMEAGSLTVAPGQVVSQGQKIGIMGTTGDSTGVHLHFEVYESGTQVDPAAYVPI